jgi:hypothetical protein
MFFSFQESSETCRTPIWGSNELEKWDYRRIGIFGDGFDLGSVQLWLRKFLTARDTTRNTIAIHFGWVVSAVVERRSWRYCGCLGNGVE